MIRPAHLLKEQFARILGSLRRRRFESDFDEELEAHLALLTERFVRQGLSPDEARYAARKQFGGVTQMKNELRDRSRFRPVEALLDDSAYVLRQLRKSPVFAMAAVLTLAIGIGANTAIFSLVDQLILRLLPIRDPQAVVLLAGRGHHYGGNNGRNALSYPMYQDFRERNPVFSEMMCRYSIPMTIGASARTEIVNGEFVSGNYFNFLGIGPVIGRVFTAQDDLYAGAHPYAVLSYAYWQSNFAGDPRVIGQVIRVNNYPLTIIGVSQRGFDGVEPGLPNQIRIPVTMAPTLRPAFTN